MLSGRTTAIAGSLRDYRADDGAVPETGELGIVVDGRGTPAALVVVTEALTVPYAEVDAGDHRRRGLRVRPRHRPWSCSGSGCSTPREPVGPDAGHH